MLHHLICSDFLFCPVLFLHLYLLYIILLFSILDTTNTDVSTENVHRTVTSIDTTYKELLLLLEILRISLIEMESESGKDSKENINMSVRVTEKYMSQSSACMCETQFNKDLFK